MGHPRTRVTRIASQTLCQGRPAGWRPDDGVGRRVVRAALHVRHLTGGHACVHATSMTRSRWAGLIALIAGIIIVLYKLSVDGTGLSFVLLLGVLCIADGILRLTVE